MKPRGGEGQNGRLKCPMGFLVINKINLHEEESILLSLVPMINDLKTNDVTFFDKH